MGAQTAGEVRGLRRPERMMAMLSENPELLPPRRLVMPSGRPRTPKTMQANGMAKCLWISTHAALYVSRSPWRTCNDNYII